MNIERGIKRILIVLTFPLFLIAISLMAYGYSKALITNRTLNKKIDAYISQKIKSGPPDGFVNEQARNEWIDVEAKWDDFAPGELTWNQLSAKVKHLKNMGALGLLLLGGSSLLWGLYFSGIWIMKGFKNQGTE